MAIKDEVISVERTVTGDEAMPNPTPRTGVRHIASLLVIGHTPIMIDGRTNRPALDPNRRRTSSHIADLMNRSPDDSLAKGVE